MKKTTMIMLFVLTLALAAGAAGFERGTKTLGGSFSLSGVTYSEASDTFYVLTISPRVGYFVARNLCVDIAPTYTHYFFPNGEDYSGGGIGGGLRYFFGRFYVGGAYHWTKTGMPGYKHTEEYLTVSLGRLFELVKHVYLDAALTYERGLTEYRNPETTWDNKSSTIVGKVGLAVYFK